MLTKTTLHATIPISRTVSVVQQLSATAFYPHGFATMDKTLFVRDTAYPTSQDAGGAACAVAKVQAVCMLDAPTLGIGGAPGRQYKKAPVAGGSAYPS